MVSSAVLPSCLNTDGGAFLLFSLHRQLNKVICLHHHETVYLPLSKSVRVCVRACMCVHVSEEESGKILFSNQPSSPGDDQRHGI